jgi:hypothetical protein
MNPVPREVVCRCNFKPILPIESKKPTLERRMAVIGRILILGEFLRIVLEYGTLGPLIAKVRLIQIPPLLHPSERKTGARSGDPSCGAGVARG